jgi:ADP-ribosyl-[dinitrogen reductase] hydrolase
VDLTPVQKDRAVGSLMGLACGDALGAGHEFKPSRPYTQELQMTGGGGFNWKPGEWTDDTAMALCIAQVSAQGIDLLSKAGLDQIVTNWLTWAATSKDVGIQTRAVFNDCGPNANAEQMFVSAEKIHHQNGQSAGNGSLMRTAPVALAYLDDKETLIEAARTISNLTHFEQTAADACVLWCLAIRHCVLKGELPDIRDFVQELNFDVQEYWMNVINDAEAAESHTFPNNGWVVTAFQAAWSAIKHARVPVDRADLRLFPAQHFAIALERAVRCGGDTDTVAAIAGQILGAKWGSTAIPLRWRRLLHGYPNLNNRDLMELAVLTVDKGQVDNVGWPSIDLIDDSHWSGSSTVVVAAVNSHITAGGHGALHNHPAGMGAAISLCRVGRNETELDSSDHLQIMIVDDNGHEDNSNLAFTFNEIAQQIEGFMSEGKHVVVHCVQAHSRTPSALIAFCMNRFGWSYEESLESVKEAFPDAEPNNAFKSALQSLHINLENYSPFIGSSRNPSTLNKRVFGDRDIYLEGRLEWITNPDRMLQLLFLTPFGDFIRKGGAWIEDDEVFPGMRLDSELDLLGESTLEEALEIVAEFDQAQFESKTAAC